MCPPPKNGSKPRNSSMSATTTPDAPGAPDMPPSSIPPPTERPSSGGAGIVGGSETSLASPDSQPIYPPTQVEKWLTCPRLWHLSQKYVLRSERWTPNKAIGTAVHIGVLEHLRMVQEKRPTSMEHCIDAAFHSLDNEFDHEQETWTLEACRTHVRKGVTMGIEANLPGGRPIVAVEPSIHGRKPDYILRDREGLMVDDLKVTMSLESKNLPYRQREYAHSWQGHDYLFWVSQYYAEPAVWWRPVLIILGPRQLVVPTPIRITPEKLKFWSPGAETLWRRMDKDKMRYEISGVQPPQNFRACTGKAHHYTEEQCPMYPICHTLMGDESVYPSMLRRKE